MRSSELKKSQTLYSICGKDGLNSMYVHVFPSEVTVTSWNEYVGDYIRAKKERSDAAEYFKTAREKGLKIQKI
tara:strand:+ start:87 stop:305 length:219 start_codon:yes stop_codon:yes gene_type:complete